MYRLISNVLNFISKPIITAVLRRKGYPESAISAKYGDIISDGFTDKDDVMMFHGVSVGEVVALENLVKAAGKKFPDRKIVVTTGTHTGQETAKKKFGEVADLITYFPVDFSCVVNKFLDKVKPSCVCIAETEIWPNFAMECKRRGIKIYIINGRISDSTFKSYLSFRFLFKYFLNFYTGIYTQSDEDNDKFLRLGANPDSTKRMNNLKFDIKQPDVNFEFSKSNSRVLLAGSTHSGEDEVVLYNFRRLKEKYSDLKLIIAPRHLTRGDEVIALIKSFRYKYSLRSAGVNSLEGIDVLVLDTLGELGKMYKFSDISFIGGSFNKTGGHNPLESVVFGKPVISGPSIYNFKDIYGIIRNAEAGFVVDDREEFFEIADRLLGDEKYYNKVAHNCEKVFAEQQGALEFVLNLLQ